MALATLSIDIEARLAGLQDGLDKASRLAEKNAAQIEASFSGLRNAATALQGVFAGVFAGLGAGALANMVATVNEGVSALKSLRDATGASIENISALEHVAASTGTSFETVSSSLIKFNKALTDAGRTPEIAAVFKGLGLDVERLKQADPAEALRQTAEAMAQFADDGAKARAAQELFGRSLADVAPFLVNLAESGQLHATVTTEQALAAERLSNSLAALRKASEDNARTFVAQVVPALQQVIDELGGGAGQADLFAAAGRGLRTVLEAVVILGSDVSFVFKGIGREIGAWAAQLAALARLDFAGFSAISEAVKEDAARARAELDAFQQRLLTAGRTVDDPTNFGNEGRRGGRQSLFLPEAVGKKGSRAAADRESDLDKYIRKLIEAQQATLDLSTEEQARLDIATGKLGKLNALQEQQVLDLARGLDILKAVPAFVGPQIDEATLAARDAAQRNLERLIGETLPAKMAELTQLSESLNRAIAEGTITDEEHASAVAILAQRYEDLAPKVEEATKKIDEFTAQAARNIQDALGDTVLKTLQGDFDNILELWSNMIKRMLAEAVGAQLGKALLGDYAKSGEVGGILGDIFKAIGGGGAGANYGNEGRNYPAPIVATASAGGRSATMSAGGGVVFQNTYHIGQGVSRGEVATAVGQGNRALLEQLRADGRV